MRIVYDARCFFEPKTGVGHYAYDLLQNLLDLDTVDSYTLFYGMAMRPSKLPLPDFSHKGVDTVLIKWPGRLFDMFINKFPGIPVDWMIGKYDVFHCPNFVPPPLKGNVVISAHDLAYKVYPEFFPATILNSLEKHLERSANTAKHIITISESTKRDLVKFFSLDPDKISVIYPAARSIFRPIKDEELIDNTKCSYGIDGPFIGFFATLEPRKNAAVLIRAFSILKKRRPDLEHKLVLAGGKGWHNEELWKTVFSSGVEHEIIVTGYVDEDHLPVLISAADVMVYPSLYEGFGLPPLEAMACGTPVITSNTSSLPEVVGDAGIMVDPLDEEALADAMESVLTDSGLADDLSRRGLERAKLFSWERAARETLEVYKKAAS